MSALKKTNLDQVTEYWGSHPPDWVIALARACDEANQAKAAPRTGYSAGAINQVIRNRYKGDLKAVEKAVRGAFMNLDVACPVLGQIPANECHSNQRKPYANTNPLRLTLYRACRAGCPHAKENLAQ